MHSAAVSEARALAARPVRVVEGQHVLATRRLVDSREEQELLESLLERVKPPLADDVRHLHYLLAAPFRYPPLRHGTRFGRPTERGILYASERVATAMAEVAYYRFVFREHTSARLPPTSVELTSFRVALETPRALDLLRPPYAERADEISSPTSWRASQEIGAAARRAGIEVLRYRSARDPRGGANLAVLAPRAIADPQPRRLENWQCVTDDVRVEIVRKDFRRDRVFAFPRETFLVDGTLPIPGEAR
ncbi:MAG: RES family NAD+ phosphorylase [Acidobacteriota bacterium]